MDNQRSVFYEKYSEMLRNKNVNNSSLTKIKYDEFVNIKQAKIKKNGKTSCEHKLLKKSDVINIMDEEILIVPINEDKIIKYFVHNDELYTIIHASNISIGHGGRNRLERELQEKYKNITRDSIMLYLNLCKTCQKKGSTVKKGLVVKPVVSTEMNARCQVDLIDMQAQPDGDYKFILIYQDYMTKFVLLRPLKYKRAEEVTYVLLGIFTTFGAPCILQSDNGREFVNRIIEELCSMWSELKIVHGKPRHSQSQGSVE